MVGPVPPLPPKPEVPAVVAQVLIAAALSTSACAATQPRIGQPPPVRIGERQPPYEPPPVRIGAEQLTVDAEGRALVAAGEVEVAHPGFVGQLVSVECGAKIVELVRVALHQPRPDSIEYTKQPVRIGMHPGD